MAIAVSVLAAAFAAELGRGVNDVRLQPLMVLAINNSLDELSIAQNRTTAYTHINHVNDDIDSSLDDRYQYALSHGIRYWLVRMGVRPSDPRMAIVLYRDTEDAWRRARGDVWGGEVNQTQADEDEDMARLGAAE